MSFEDDVDTTEEHERRIVRCRSCRARIVWLVTDTGKKIPVDADTVEATDELFVWGRHITHFKTCPHANDWRRSR